MSFFDSIKDGIRGMIVNHNKNKGFMTDDERELREYEEYYTPQSGVAEGTYAEFVVSDVMAISGNGVVVVGTVTGGVFFVGDKVTIMRSRDAEVDTEIVGIEQFRKACVSVTEGANAAFMLKDIDKKQVSRNDIIKRADCNKEKQLAEEAADNKEE